MKAVIISVGLVLEFLLLTACAQTTSDAVDPIVLPLRSGVDQFDFGLARIDRDHHYDLYTVNHGFAQSFFGDHEGRFKPIAEAIQPLPIGEQPGMDMQAGGPNPDLGVHIYRYRRWLYLISISEHEPVTGELWIPRPTDEPESVSYSLDGGATVEALASEEPTLARFGFSVPAMGRVVFDTLYIEVPMQLKLEGSSIERVRLGYDGVRPIGPDVALRWYDRHSMAWARIDSDPHSDVFMGLGGLRGRIDAFPKTMVHDLFLTGGEWPMADHSAGRGFDKRTCRSYRSEWVDFDSDNDLDLYIGCMGGANQLYEQVSPGQFRDVAPALGLDLINAEQFRWVDWDADGQLELLFASVRRVGIMDRKPGSRYQEVFLTRPVGTDRVYDLRLASLGDSDFPSVMIVAENSSQLLIRNAAGGQAMIPPGQLGLPVTINSGSWLDFNRDGRLDYYDINAGLFIRSGQGFEAADTPMAQRNDWVDGQSVWWIDDRQGCWNVVQGGKYRMSPERRDGARARTRDTGLPTTPIWDQLLHWPDVACDGHWLAVDLQGPAGNQEGIGAVIDVKGLSFGRQRNWVHGTGDTTFSQGHYRSYFGTAQDRKVDVQVRWADGKTCRMEQVDSDQRITVDYGDCAH